MKLDITRDAAAPAAMLSGVARITVGLFLERAPHNGSWISILLGAALAMPMLLVLSRLPARGHSTVKRIAMAGLMLAALVFSAVEAGQAAHTLTQSAGMLALDRVSGAWLAAPLLAALLWCLSRGGTALGEGARVWCRVLPALLLIVVALQLRTYRAVWLMPVLGGGWPMILEDACRVAGWMLESGLLIALAREDANEATSQPDAGETRLHDTRPAAGTFLKTAALTALAAVLIALLALMMTPTLASPAAGSRLNRLDALITNGRAPLYVQLFAITVWFVAMLNLMLARAFTAALALQRLIPRLEGRVCIAAAVLLTGAAAAGAEAVSPWMGRASPYQGLLLAVPALALACGNLSKEGESSCGNGSALP